MKILLLFFFCLSAWGQVDIQSILDRDPFDPDRGQKEEDKVEEEEEQILPLDLPVLDGTIIVGETRIAIFSFLLEGKPASARARLNDTVAGYTVNKIERNLVEITGDAEPISLALYAGKKDKRGGSKKAGRAVKALPAPKTIVTPGGDKEGAENAAKPTTAPAKPNFSTRKRPQPSSSAKEKMKRLKTKF